MYRARASAKGRHGTSRSIVVDDVVAKVIGLVLVQRFDEREQFLKARGEGVQRAKSTCAGADLPPEEEAYDSRKVL